MLLFQLVRIFYCDISQPVWMKQLVCRPTMSPCDLTEQRDRGFGVPIHWYEVYWCLFHRTYGSAFGLHPPRQTAKAEENGIKNHLKLRCASLQMEHQRENIGPGRVTESFYR